MPSVPTHRFLLLLPALLLASSCGINNIPILEQAVNDAWVEVQAHYRKRADLVMLVLEIAEPWKQSEPGLLEDLFEEVNAAETRVFEMHVGPDTLEEEAAFSDFRDRQDTLSAALQKLLDTLQQYPETEQTREIESLRSELSENSKLIDVAKRDYWQKVERFNSELVTAPGRWWRAFVYPKAVKKENFQEPTEERGQTDQSS